MKGGSPGNPSDPSGGPVAYDFYSIPAGRNCDADLDLAWTARSWRLSATQIARTAEALVKAFDDGLDLSTSIDLSNAPAAPFTGEAKIGRFKNAQPVVEVSPGNIDSVMAFSQWAAGRVARAAEAECIKDDGALRPNCARAVLQTVERILFRRPALDASVEARMEALTSWSRETSTFDAFAATVQSYFVSPNFLFRAEIAPDGKLDPFALAEAIAYSLTDAPPDAELFAKAENGSILEANEVRDTVARLVESEAGRKTAMRFIREFFEYDRALDTPKDDPPPNYDVSKLVADTDALVADVIEKRLGKGGILSELLTSHEVFASSHTDTYYDMSKIRDDVPKRQGVAAGRAGIMTQPSWLIATSEPHHNNPMKRGLFVLDSFLCSGLPMVDIPDVAPLEVEDGETLRQALSEHAENPGCRACHDRMDPMGYVFERFDHFGRYREQENGIDVDASGAFSLLESDLNRPFDGPEDFATLLSQSDIAHGCFLNRVFQFYLGTEAEQDSSCHMRKKAYEAYRDGNDSIVAFLGEVFAAPTFIERGEN
jgi:hypothetical protein